MYRPLTPSTTGYANVPDSLIIDIRDELVQFQTDAADLRDVEYYNDELVTEVLLFISDRNYLQTGIEDLRKHFYHMLVRDGHHFDAEVFSKAVVKLATALSTRLIALGAYMADGNLPFEIKKWITTSEPVLTKNLDYMP